MSMDIEKWVSVDIHDVAEHCRNNPEYLAGILDCLGAEFDVGDRWFREFAEALEDDGETALHQLVGKLMEHRRAETTSVDEGA